MSFFGELRRRNVFRVGIAYLAVVWLLLQVADLVLPILDAPPWLLRALFFSSVLGLPLALVLAWFYELTPEGIRVASEVEAVESVRFTGRKLDFAIIGVLVLAVGFLLVRPPFDDQAAVLPNSVAVLLCDNLSPDPDDAYIAASIHEEILNQLYKIRALNVIARTSVMQYADAPSPISQIAEDLNVQTVMECSVRYAGDAILVTAQLIDPETNGRLWSATYPGDLSDLSTVFAMQVDIAMNIANAFEVEFSQAEQESIEKKPTESPEAFRYYLRALTAPPGAGVTRLLLDQAIEADPNFALAYAWKAYWYTFEVVGVGGAGPDEAAEIERLLRVNAQQALDLDPTLGIAQAALAVLDYVNWRGAEAEQAFQQAMKLNPKNVNVLMLYGRFKRYRGEFDEAIQLLRSAADLDPENYHLLDQLALTYRRSGNWDAAAAIYMDLLNHSPGFIGFNIGFATVEALRGNHDEAVRHLGLAESLDPNPYRLSQMAHVYALADQPEHARRLFAEFEQRANEAPVGNAVWVRAYVAVGEYEQALQRLESVIQNLVPTDQAALLAIKANPWGDPELDKPVFRDLLGSLWNDE